MNVPLQLSFRNVEPSEAVARKIRERTAWLELYCNQIISCRVVVEIPHKHHKKGNLYHIRIDIRVPDREIVVSRKPDSHHAYEDIYVTIQDAFDEARRELQDYKRRRRCEVKHLEHPPRAHVIRLVQGDGKYGFIRTDEGRELYFHENSVLNGDFDRLKVGSEVRFSEERGDEGPQASTVEVIRKKQIHA